MFHKKVSEFLPEAASQRVFLLATLGLEWSRLLVESLKNPATATITDPRLRALEARRVSGEFVLEDIRNTPTQTEVPQSVSDYFHKNMFNRAAREMANRDTFDLKKRPGKWRTCTPPDKQTQFFNFKLKANAPGEFIADVPTADYHHNVTLRYLGEKNGEHIFHYISFRQHKADPTNRLIMEGVAVLSQDGKKRPGLELSHLGFGSELPQNPDGTYKDLVPNYREAALLNATPKEVLRAMLG